jgi:hypothetical protein
MAKLNPNQTTGIRTYLNQVESLDGETVAIATAERWRKVLLEMVEPACPTMNTMRPGGPQRYCVLLLLARVEEWLSQTHPDHLPAMSEFFTNPASLMGENESDESPDDTGENV